MNKVVLAISLGDPAGIGPEVATKALQNRELRSKADFIFCGDPNSIPRGLKALTAKVGWRRVGSGRSPLQYGPSAASGKIAAASVREAAALVGEGIADALVTAPLSKEALHKAGEKFDGHTEMLADFFGIKKNDVGMVLQGGPLRVFLATRHLSLRRALKKLTRPYLKEQIELCALGLRKTFGIRRPRLALAALNPHAGEDGAFGIEEKSILSPVVRAFSQRKDFTLQGPFPADTVFVKAVQENGNWDAVVCLHHDQGLIPLKLLAFDSGVNITLGLPIIRTSPDHGTAWDIAGKGKASPASFIEAAKLAVTLVSRA